MKIFSRLLVVLTMSLLAGVAHLHAAPVTSDAVMAQEIASYNKSQLIEMVSREDVRDKLVSLGVDHSDAIARIEAMTDTEINRLNQELNEAPAGGVVGAVLTVLAIIAILDLVGVTDVYPFIRPINN